MSVNINKYLLESQLFSKNRAKTVYLLPNSILWNKKRTIYQ